MNHTVPIRRLVAADAGLLMSLRRQALEGEPLAFGSSPADDRMGSVERVTNVLADVDEQAVFGTASEGELVGMVGVRRESGIKERHKASLWGMYVMPAFRKRGLGRTLLETAIEHAKAWPGATQLQLSVTEAAVQAKALYESAGFECWGREAQALCWNGRFVDEFHFVLDLK